MIEPKRILHSGFTLLETLLAIAILSTALLLLTQSWSGTALRVKKTQQQFEFAALLERKMTEIELEYRGKSIDEIPDERSEGFGDQFKEYNWSMKSKKLELPDLSSALTSQEGGADQMTMSVVKQLTDGLSKMIKEVTVTVTYNNTQNPKAKPIEMSVTTYFVDYDKEISFGVPGL